MNAAAARRAQLLSLGQPALTLLLTCCVALFIAVPAVGSWTASRGTTEPDLITRGSTIALPGRVLHQGPGTPAGDARVVQLRVGSRQRGYLLLPAIGTARRPGGLLVVLHQDVGSPTAVAEGLGLDGLRRHGVTLAYPAGIAGSWNAGDCCGTAKAEAIDDVAFLDALLDDVGRRVPVDSSRRAVLGYSGGGMLAYRFLCQGHHRLAAVVEVSGSLETSCPDRITLPDVLSVHGALDGTIGLSTGITVTRLGLAPRPVLSTLNEISRRGGCTGRTGRDVPGTRILHWSACRGGSTLDVRIVAGAGHGWDHLGAAESATAFLVRRLVAA